MEIALGAVDRWSRDPCRFLPSSYPPGRVVRCAIGKAPRFTSGSCPRCDIQLGHAVGTEEQSRLQGDVRVDLESPSYVFLGYTPRRNPNTICWRLEPSCTLVSVNKNSVIYVKYTNTTRIQHSTRPEHQGGRGAGWSRLLLPDVRRLYVITAMDMQQLPFGTPRRKVD